MAPDETFARAFLHGLPPDFTPADPWTTHTVMGRGLRPFCLWHRFLLEAVESPLLNPAAGLGGEPAITAHDLLHAVVICGARFRRWPLGEKLTFRDFLRTAQVSRLARQLAAFNAYIEDFTSRPDFSLKSSGGGARPSSAGQPPETFRMAAELIGWSGWADATVWELPLSEVEWYLAQVLRERAAPLGSEVDFMTAETRELQRQMKAAKVARERETEGVRDRGNEGRRERAEDTAISPSLRPSVPPSRHVPPSS